MLFLPEASLPHRDEVTTDPMFVNMTYDRYISPDFENNSSESVNHALSCTAWNAGCDLLKIVYGTKILHWKMNWRIWAIQTYMFCVIGRHTFKTILIHSRCLQINSFVTVVVSALIFQQGLFHISKWIQWKQHKIIGRKLLIFKERYRIR